MKKTFVFAVLSFVLWACSDAPYPTDSPSTHSGGKSLNLSSAEAQTALTRAIALALADSALRARVLEDMRESPFLEHKIDLAKYLREPKGGLLRSRMRDRAGVSEANIDLMLRTSRSLEFYVPVAAHRRTWTGGADLIVASASTDDRIAPIGFTLGGDPYPLSLEQPPPVPVLALAPVETDFTKPIDVNLFENTDDVGGRAIGEYKQPSRRSLTKAQQCDEGTPGCGGSGGTPPGPGIYVTRNHVFDLHEPWVMGEPEIEIHTLTSSGANPLSQIRCVRESGYASLYFRQNDHSWIGLALVGPQNDINALPSNQGLEFVVWEDDNTTCVVKTDNASWGDWAYGAWSVAGSVYAWTAGANFVIPLGGIVAAILITQPAEDDLVGQIVGGTCSAGGVTHNARILLGTSQAGCTELVKRQ